MKFETTAAFDSDYRSLKAEHRATFRAVLREKFAPACDEFASDPSTPWPASLRVKPVRNAAGVLETTWSFADPDGQATFELVIVDDQLRCRWRRVGDQAVFSGP